MKQLTLLDRSLNATYAEERIVSTDGVFIRWLKYRRDNPNVEKKLIELVRYAQGIGLMHYGIHGLFNKIRWNEALKTKGDMFKISNSYGPYYSRLLLLRYPEVRQSGGFFALRKTYWETEEEFGFYKKMVDEYVE